VCGSVGGRRFPPPCTGLQMRPWAGPQGQILQNGKVRQMRPWAEPLGLNGKVRQTRRHCGPWQGLKVRMAKCCRCGPRPGPWQSRRYDESGQRPDPRPEQVRWPDAGPAPKWLKRPVAEKFQMGIFFRNASMYRIRT
jgi:hypothetical protein